AAIEAPQPGIGKRMRLDQLAVVQPGLRWPDEISEPGRDRGRGAKREDDERNAPAAAARGFSRARDRLARSRGRHREPRRGPRTVARGGPAAVDEDVEIAALERKRRQHVIAGDPAQHLVVEEERGARDEAAACAHTPALEFDRDDPRGRDRKNGLAVGLLDLARKLELL